MSAAYSPTATASDRLSIPYGVLASLLCAFVLLIPVGIWNRYIFLEENLPILGFMVFVAALVLSAGRLPRRFYFPSVAAGFACFIIYAWSRLDDPAALDLTTKVLGQYPSGFNYVLDLLIYYALFVCAAVAYARSGRLSRVLWFLICGYMLAYMARSSLDIAGLKEGYNESPGFVLVTLAPFVFLGANTANGIKQFIPTALLVLCVAWLSLIGARTAVATLLLFYALFLAWPVIARNRFTYFATFWGAMFGIVILIGAYVLYALSNPADDVFQESVVEGAGLGIFQKRLGTRADIWLHLLYYISEQPLFGYGTDRSSMLLSPVSFLEFTMARDNLSAHSTYFELLYRLGVFGLLAYVLLLFTVWRTFWIGREQFVVRIAGAFLLSMIFFCSTGEYFVFSTLELRSGFGWIVLGIGAGACLRARKNRDGVKPVG